MNRARALGDAIHRLVADLDSEVTELERRRDALRVEVFQLEIDCEPARKAAHNAWQRGERSEWARLGEAAYHRARRRSLVRCDDCGRNLLAAKLPAHRRAVHFALTEQRKSA